MRKWLPFPPDYLLEFLWETVTRADTIAGAVALIVSFIVDDKAAGTALLVIGTVALFYGAYDTYRRERVMRTAREQELRVMAHVAQGNRDHPSFGETSGSIVHAFVTTDIELVATKSPITTRSMYAVVTETTRGRWPLRREHTTDIKQVRRWAGPAGPSGGPASISDRTTDFVVTVHPSAPHHARATFQEVDFDPIETTGELHVDLVVATNSPWGSYRVPISPR